MFFNYVMLIIGFAILIVSADKLVEGSSSLAKRFNISNLIIGLTIVSFGTSAPELIVNLIASFQNQSDLAIGNILGSNIANIFLILGISSLIISIPVSRSTIVSEIPFSLTAALLFGFLANAHIFESSAQNLTITRMDGWILLSFFFLFLIYIIYMAKQNQDSDDEEFKLMNNKKAMLFVIGGITGLFFGGKFVVDSAVEIATSWGMSQTFIGLTIVGVGTSLPELVTSAVAALKKNSDIAVGNVVGSNIFNILWILGISALINPMKFNIASNTDIMVIIFGSTLLLLFMIIGKKFTLQRWQGFLFIVIYIIYLYYLIQRG